MRSLNPKATVSIAEFGRVVPNDWPLVVPAKFMLSGKARDFWYIHNMGKSPVFRGAGAAEKAIRKLYREFGHLVTRGQCRYAYATQKQRSIRRRLEFHQAVAWDVLAGRMRVRDRNLEIVGMGSAQLSNAS
jgi:hypothetical protein